MPPTYHEYERMEDHEGVSKDSGCPVIAVLYEYCDLVGEPLDGVVSILPAQHDDGQDDLEGEAPQHWPPLDLAAHSRHTEGRRFLLPYLLLY